jgi:hypothetical protein
VIFRIRMGKTRPPKADLDSALIRPRMQTVHLIVGIAVIASNLVAGTVGGIAWLRSSPSIWFWYLLRVAQATVVLQVLLGTLLLLTGKEAVDGLH